MLVLTRKIGEKIIVNHNITVEVVAIERGQIKLGITAPLSVTITRAELLPTVAPVDVVAECLERR